MEIKCQKIGFRYQRNCPNVLNEINLKFSSGTINSIIGTNGSGKSTLLNLICGYLRPTKGKVIFDDIVYSRRSSEIETVFLMKKIGYLPQTINNKVSSKTVLEELNIKKEEVEDIFKILNISLSVLDEEYAFLNNCLKRKVALSKILIYNPNIIVLDEPTAGLDNITKKSLINYLIKLKRMDNKIIIIASNDIDFVNRVSDNVIILEKGNVIKSENKSDVFRDVNFFDIHKISVPKIIEFEDFVLKEKNIRLGYRDEINDLIKDILRKN